MKNLLSHFSELTRAFILIIAFVLAYNYIIVRQNTPTTNPVSKNELVSLLFNQPQRVEELYGLIPEQQEQQFVSPTEESELLCQFDVSSVVIGDYRLGQCPSNLSFISAELMDPTVYTPYVTILMYVTIESTCQTLINVTFNLPYLEDIRTNNITELSVDNIFVRDGFNQIRTIVQVDKFSNNNIYKEFVPRLTEVCTEKQNSQLRKRNDSAQKKRCTPLFSLGSQENEFSQSQRYKKQSNKFEENKRTCTKISSMFDPQIQNNRSKDLEKYDDSELMKRFGMNDGKKRLFSLGDVGDIISELVETLPQEVIEKFGNAVQDVVRVVKSPVTGTARLALKGLIDNVLALGEFAQANARLVQTIKGVIEGSTAPAHILFAFAKIASPILRSPPGVIFITSRNNPIAPIFDAFNNSLEKLLLPEVINSVPNPDQTTLDIVNGVIDSIKQATNETQLDFFCDPINLREYITQCSQSRTPQVCRKLYDSICFN